MEKCYNFNKIEFNNSLLNNFVDVTYIIHLEGNGRLSNIIDQLTIFQPTNIIYILFNKGYKKCNKIPHISTPPYDLVDAFLQCFKHADENNYNNILILEDDFIFSEKIKDEEHILNIKNFTNKQNNKNFIYLLGCLPFLRLPVFYDTNHSHLIGSGGTHAIIYSKQFRENILKTNTDKITDWDIFLTTFKKIKYCYYLPLCYQLFTETENSKYWGGANIIRKIFNKIKLKIFRLLNLHIYVEPGYSIFYFLSNINIFILVLIIYLINKNKLFL